MRPVESEPTTPELDETAPQNTAKIEPEGSQHIPSRSGSSTRRRIIRIFLVYLTALIAIGLVAYFQGRGLNNAEQIAQVSEAMYEQFELGITDLEAGRYEIARQRFEAIINFDPAYPGAEDMLVEALINLNVPTVTPTSEPTPTPDPSPPEDLMEQAKAALAEEDWDTVIHKLLSLRAKDPTYQPVKVDGLMYIALRNKGMELIGQGLMEEGLYNLSLANRFGPLDRDAMFRMTLAQQYLLANSYIGLIGLALLSSFNHSANKSPHSIPAENTLNLHGNTATYSGTRMINAALLSNTMLRLTPGNSLIWHRQPRKLMMFVQPNRRLHQCQPQPRHPPRHQHPVATAAEASGDTWLIPWPTLKFAYVYQ